MFHGRYGATKTSWKLNKTLQKRVHVGFLFSLLHVLKMKFKGPGRFQNVTLLGWRSRLKHVLPGNVIVTFSWRRMVHWVITFCFAAITLLILLAGFLWRHRHVMYRQRHVIEVDPWCTSEVWFHGIGRGGSDCIVQLKYMCTLPILSRLSWQCIKKINVLNVI